MSLAGQRGPKPNRFLVLHREPNPSTDYYLRPRLPPDRTDYGLLTERPPAEGLRRGTFVVLCRDANKRWLDWLDDCRPALSGVALFLDDDLDAALWDSSLQKRYRFRTWKRHHRVLPKLRNLLTDFWVSTRRLAERYARCNPLVLPPVPPQLSPDRHADRPRTIIAYHGTRAHKREVKWLAPILDDVLRRHQDCHFQVFAADDIRHLVQDLPRTEVLAPRSWAAYQEYCEQHPVDIGLAPLLATTFNAARSCTKVYDIARTNAAGIYSDFGPYTDFVRHGCDGLLASDDPQEWRGAIARLLTDKDLRVRLRTAMLNRLAAVRSELLSDRSWAEGIGYVD